MRHIRLLSVLSFVFASLSSASFSVVTAQSDTAAKNKAVVQRVYSEVFGKGNIALISELFSADYIQHSPNVMNRRQGLIDLVTAMSKQSAVPTFTIKHIIAQGDYVGVHSQGSTTPNRKQAWRDMHWLAGINWNCTYLRHL